MAACQRREIDNVIRESEGRSAPHRSVHHFGCRVQSSCELESGCILTPRRFLRQDIITWTLFQETRATTVMSTKVGYCAQVNLCASELTFNKVSLRVKMNGKVLEMSCTSKRPPASPCSIAECPCETEIIAECSERLFSFLSSVCERTGFETKWIVSPNSLVN